MSQGLMAYLVPTHETIGVIGSKDKALLDNVPEQMADDVASLEEQFDTDSEEYGPGLTFTQAMEELFEGRFSQLENCPFMYTYAFEIVCRYYGEWLGNRFFCPSRHTWFERLDDILAGGGVPLRFHDLLYRPPPRVPDSDGDPCLGHWREEEMAAALPRLKGLVPSLTGDEQKALESVEEWLVKAVEHPGAIVVGVFC